MYTSHGQTSSGMEKGDLTLLELQAYFNADDFTVVNKGNPFYNAFPLHC
jgi:hypothetical protein